jgi:uncharacterized protein Usg
MTRVEWRLCGQGRGRRNPRNAIGFLALLARRFITMIDARNVKPGVSEDFIRQLAGYGLATAEILYRLPDHPRLLQTYIWQEYDLAPHFPTLIKFLNFWTQKLEGPLHSVRVGHSKLIRPAEIRAIDGEFRLN